MTEMPEYEVYAIKYGDHKRMRQENFLFKDPHDEASSIDFMIWVIQGGGKTYVVDVGFEQKEAEARGRSLHRLPSEAVRMLGGDPDKIEDVQRHSALLEARACQRAENVTEHRGKNFRR